MSRSIFDYALRSKDIGSLFRHLLLRQKKRAGSIPECPTPDDPAITQLLKKLLSQVSSLGPESWAGTGSTGFCSLCLASCFLLGVQGMTEAEEDKLLALRDFMLKSNKAKANMGDQGHLGDGAQTGVIDLATLGITGRQVDLVKPKAEADDKRGGQRARTCAHTHTITHLSRFMRLV